MPMLTVDKAADSSLFTEESFWQNGPEVHDAFTKRWIAVMPEEKLPPNMVDFLEFLALDLSGSRTEMVDSAQDHEIKLGGDSEMRSERDGAYSGLNTVYLDERGLFVSIYGRPAAKAMGFSFPRHEHPARFGRQTGMLLRNLKKLDPEVPIPAPEGKEELAIKPSRIIKALEGPHKRLKDALKAVLVDVRKSQKTHKAKDKALSRQVKNFSTHAKCGEMIYRIVGLEPEADQVRPSVRQPGQRAAVVRAEDDLAPVPVGPGPAPAAAADDQS